MRKKYRWFGLGLEFCVGTLTIQLRYRRWEFGGFRNSILSGWHLGPVMVARRYAERNLRWSQRLVPNLMRGTWVRYE